jgi:hypothetical protein
MATGRILVRASALSVSLVAVTLIGLALFASASAEGTTRYVAPGGSDGPGDTPNPCLNDELPCATIQHAVEQSAPGDTIAVAAAPTPSRSPSTGA